MGDVLAALDSETPNASRLHLLARHYLAETHHHLNAVKRRFDEKTKVGAPMSTNQTDTPSELGCYSDGVTDDASFTPELVGCGSISGGIQHLSVAGGLSSLAVGGNLGSLTIAGLPSYLFSRKNLSNPVVRRRLGAAIKAMTPKLRRRVLDRLRAAVSVARVSGEVRSAYPSVSGVGWDGIMVSGSRRGGCPYANVAGALTP